MRTGHPLVEASGLSKTYRRGRRRSAVRAVDDVSLAIQRGQCLSIVGESGAGKSTLGRLVLGLEAADAGRVVFDGQDLAALPRGALRRLRRRIQLVPQDPLSSLDPVLSIETSLSEPLLAHHLGDRRARQRRLRDLLEMMSLPPDALPRRPTAFSGGQRQRLALIRALAPRPDLIVLDEPVSALDRPTQASILGLLETIRDMHGQTVLLITHDVSIVARLADQVVVLRDGRVVESGETRHVLHHPTHPYTAALLRS